MSQYIKNLLNTAGWKEIESMFDKTILDCKNQDINENLNAEEYKIIHLANQKTAKNLEALKRRIKLGGLAPSSKPKNYK